MVRIPFLLCLAPLIVGVLGAWTAFGYALSHGVGILIVFIALFGLVVGKSGRLVAMQHSDPMSDKSMSVSTPLRGWGIGLGAVVFALINALRDRT